MGRGARLVGELAGVADLRSDAFGGIGELAGGLRKGGRGALGFVRAQAERVGALADRGQRGGRGLRAAGNGVRRALQLANHAAKLDFKQFENLPAQFGFRVIRNRSHYSRLGLGFGARHGQFGHGFPEQSNGHSVSRPRV